MVKVIFLYVHETVKLIICIAYRNVSMLTEHQPQSDKRCMPSINWSCPLS